MINIFKRPINRDFNEYIDEYYAEVEFDDDKIKDLLFDLQFSTEGEKIFEAFKKNDSAEMGRLLYIYLQDGLSDSALSYAHKRQEQDIWL